MFPWLVNVFMDVVLRKDVERLRISGLNLCGAKCERKWKVDCYMFADDTAMLAGFIG